MKNLLRLFMLFVMTIGVLSACNKNKCDKSDPGLGGGVSITGTVMHNTTLVSHAVVFIKYNATEFPGADTTLYDSRLKSTSEAAFAFHNLKPGDYYLYAVGFDNTAQVPVTGGVGAEVCDDEGEVKTNIAVVN